MASLLPIVEPEHRTGADGSLGMPGKHPFSQPRFHRQDPTVLWPFSSYTYKSLAWSGSLLRLFRSGQANLCIYGVILGVVWHALSRICVVSRGDGVRQRVRRDDGVESEARRRGGEATTVKVITLPRCGDNATALARRADSLTAASTPSTRPRDA